MRQIGFSTGALAYSDFRKALALLRSTDMDAVELSALREEELEPLAEAVDTLDLTQFDYVSIHAPSFFKREQEPSVVHTLVNLAARDWPIIVHPDAIYDWDRWRPLGGALCLENMDKRKPSGRSADEMNRFFELLPEAGFCFDIGHARQFDSTMTEAYLLLSAFQKRLRQVHVSEVNTSSKHDVMSYGSILAFRTVAHLIPVGIPLILETPTRPQELEAEIKQVRHAFPVCVAA
jgi:sugar phosphate isomerase/epimerase